MPDDLVYMEYIEHEIFMVAMQIGKSEKNGWSAVLESGECLGYFEDKAELFKCLMFYYLNDLSEVMEKVNEAYLILGNL